MMKSGFSAALAVCFLLLAALPVSSKELPSSVGRKISTFELRDSTGKPRSLADFAEKKIVVVAFLGVECPLVKLYVDRLEALSQEFSSQGVSFLGVNSNQQDSLAEIQHFVRTNAVHFPLLKDPGNIVADQFSATRTPEVFVLDEKRVVRYQGRIDDQYTYGIQRPRIEHDYLRECLQELLAGKPVATPSTETVGCHIGRVFKSQKDSGVTYSKQISRILQSRCVECHRPNEIGPFSLTEYDEVVGWAEMIAEVVSEQRMPPWHANPQHGDFVNDVRLTKEQKQQIFDWVDSGAPQGNPDDLPEPRAFTEGWRIPKPDLVVYMDDKPFQVPAKGEVKYQYFKVNPGFKKDMWVRAAECQPGNRAVVHHIIVAVLPPGGRFAGSIGGLQSDWLAATAPGGQAMILRDGMAKKIPAGSQLIFQMHYTPTGTPQEDRSSIGLVFTEEEKVKQVVATQKAVNTKILIPAGAENHPEESWYLFRKKSLMLAMFPHMHLRGKAFRYTAIYPDGEKEILLDIPQYDFNWQNAYAFRQPKLMPAGTKLHCEARFDNSEDNLANPDPTQAVRWGDQTWDEMMIGYFDVVLADQDLIQERLDAKNKPSRVDAFLAAEKRGDVVISDELRSLARKAAASEKDFERFALALQKVAPQLDRLGVTMVDGKKLKVVVAAQDSKLRLAVGGRGISIDANFSRLAAYGEKPAGAAIVNQDVSKVLAPDMKFMSRVFHSSAHVPITWEGNPATVNFWSRERISSRRHQNIRGNHGRSAPGGKVISS